MSSQILSIVQIILGIALVALILVQTKGTGLGSTFGGEVSFYRTKRGVERLLFYGTIILAFLFLASALAGFLV